jgi:asparagine N-glycosylation enzyme membrane subunit Stt3
MEEDQKEDQIFKERKEKLIRFLKTKYSWISYVVLAIIVFIATKIRTRNLSGLRDITTGGWILGPDLDPFLFLRWAKHIVEKGSLMVIDTMRYMPLGYDTKEELILHPYLMAWFHKIASVFGSVSVVQSAALYPVFMFALTVVAFFLLTRKIFASSLGERKANIIALIASFFLSVIPSILPRTIAGIPEKESSAFLFLFLAFYFFLLAWKAKNNLPRYIFAILAGVTTAMMALIWGGFGYIFVILAFVVLVSFLLGQVDIRKALVYTVWLFSSVIFMSPFSTRYNLTNFLVSTTTGFAFAVFLIIVVNFILFNTKIKNYLPAKLSKISKPLASLLIAIVLGIIFASILFGPIFIFNKSGEIFRTLVRPVTDRLGVTVAENRQPYFEEWSNSFGPVVRGIPIFFWLFFIGSIYLFYHLAKVFEKKEKIYLTIAYSFFLIAIVFSRYSPNGILNGTNFTSLALYLLGFLVLILTFGYYYHKYHKLNKEENLKGMDFGLVLIFAFFFLSIISARGAVRLIMMLVPPTSIIVSYFVVVSVANAGKIKDETGKTITWILVALIVLSSIFAAFSFYSASNATARGYMPSVYNQQWQKSMSWVRTNTSEDAVFGHWWDYGYWVQTMGERATVLDGGNAIVYWNHLMGRHALTGPDNMAALEFLYSHNTTHFLIDPTDLGKYAAFSSIGSDENYDRKSWIPAFSKDSRQTQEKKNSTLYVYPGGTVLDGDIIYEENGTQIFLPGGKAGLGGIVIEKDVSGNLVSQPEGIYVFQGKQYRLPLRYAFDKEFIDFESGIESGIFLMPVLQENKVEKDGALFYLSSRTVKSQLARLYLYGEDNPYFKLVHSEDDFVLSQIKAQTEIGDFIYYQGFRGPIKIWEIKYPEGMQVNPEYLQTFYPNEALRWA